MKLEDSSIEQTTIRTDLGAIFVSLELSTVKWVVSSIQPGRQKISKHEVKAGATDALWALFGKLQAEAGAREKKLYPIITIQEAGYDAFWVHRVLSNKGIESHVVDPASIAVPRRRRNAKTDRVDGLRFCARCCRSSGASRGCARWSCRRPPTRRTAAAPAASARC